MKEDLKTKVQYFEDLLTAQFEKFSRENNICINEIYLGCLDSENFKYSIEIEIK